MAQLIARRYSAALFSIAAEENAIEEYESEVKTLCKIMEEDPEFLTILNHPRITSEEKAQIMEKVLKGRISDNLFGLFLLLAKKNREANILEILHAFLELAKEHKGIVTAVVESAVELTDSQLNEIKAKLSENLNKQVEMQAVLNKALIGGVKIRVDGRLIDGSIRKQLDEMKKNLMNLQLV